MAAVEEFAVAYRKTFVTATRGGEPPAHQFQTLANSGDVRRHCYEPAASSENACKLLHCAEHVHDMLDHVSPKDRIERFVAKWKPMFEVALDDHEVARVTRKPFT